MSLDIPHSLLYSMSLCLDGSHCLHYILIHFLISQPKSTDYTSYIVRVTAPPPTKTHLIILFRFLNNYSYFKVPPTKKSNLGFPQFGFLGCDGENRRLNNSISTDAF
jgi:hypothetical protein